MRGKVRGKVVWLDRTGQDRFNQIINTPFAIESHHSSIVQVADALAYVYRRYLELRTGREAYGGETALYEELVGIIEPRRNKLGRCPECEAEAFYKSVAPDGWTI